MPSTAPPPSPLDGLPPSVALDAVEAMRAAADKRLNVRYPPRGLAPALTAVVSHKVNERRTRKFDPALTSALLQRELIVLKHGKGILTDKGHEHLPFLVVWAALVKDPPEPSTLSSIIGADIAGDIAKTLTQELEGVVAHAEGNVIKVALNAPPEHSIDFSADLAELDEELTTDE